jgi:hypothetical protein
MRLPICLILSSLTALIPAFGAEWRTEGDVTESGGLYSFGDAPKITDRFAVTGSITPYPQPSGGYTFDGELYLPADTVKSRKGLLFELGADGDAVLMQAGRPPLLLAGPYAGADTLRDNYIIKKNPDWLLLIGVDALCVAGAVVMMRWGNIWGPAPESWGGGDVNYLLGYGGAGFFIAAGTAVTLWQLLAPTGKVEAIGYPFPETGVKAPADRWADFGIIADADSVQLYIDGALAFESNNPGAGLAINSIEGFEARLKGLGE